MSAFASSSDRRMAESPLDVLAQELGAVAGRVEREATLRIDAAISDLRRIDAERELRLARLERAIEDRLATVRDGLPGKDADPDELARVVDHAVALAVGALPPPAPGRDADPAEIERQVNAAVTAAVEKLPAPRDGQDADPAFVAALVKQQVEVAVAALPVPKDGTSVTVDDVRPMLLDMVAAIPVPKNGDPGRDGVDGKLPIVRQWNDAVHYQGDCVVHGGATWQAVRDTGRAPPHDDWICLAAAGRDGADGRSFRVRGTWSAADAYAALDVVALGGAGFVARKDDPGECPGEGWQLIASQGKRGKEGGPGPKGEPGNAGPAVLAIDADDQGLLTLTNADGSTVTCDLYPLLSKLG